MVMGILIGMLLWQILVMIVCLLNGQNEEKTGIVGMAIPWLILNCIGFIYRKTTLVYYKKKYSSCDLYGTENDKPYFFFGSIGIKNKDIDKYYKEGENKYYIKIIRNGKDFKNTPYETMTTIRKNGFVCQEWVDKNFKK